MKRVRTTIITLVVLSGTLAFLAGCGGGGGGGSSSSSTTTTPSTSGSSGQTGGTTPPSSGDPALSGIGGQTLHGHIGGTSTNFELVFTGNATSGNYTHFENGAKLESGTFAYSKTSATTGVINISPNGQAVASTINLTYSSAGSGTYAIVQFPESGTFTF
jgi:hypothetical protein